MVRKKEAKRELILKYGLWTAAVLLVIDLLVLFFVKTIHLSVFADFINIIIAFSVVLISFFCYKNIPKKNSAEKKFLLILFVALIFRFFGELSWAYFDLFVKFIPDFSVADVMWMLSNFTFLAGLTYHLGETKMPHKKTAVVIFTSVMAIIGLLFIGSIYFISLNIEPSEKFAFLINESYVLFDLFILIPLVIAIYSSRKHKSFLFYFFMALGFVAYVIYDLIFAQMFLRGTYFSGGQIESLYFFSYFLIFCAFYFRGKEIEGK
ncbi:MAG: hypothetical protein WC511_01105 [Candidatus Pacearchaeota archaeon]